MIGAGGAPIDLDQLAVLRRLRAAGLDPAVLYVEAHPEAEQAEGGEG